MASTRAWRGRRPPRRARRPWARGRRRSRRSAPARRGARAARPGRRRWRAGRPTMTTASGARARNSATIGRVRLTGHLGGGLGGGGHRGQERARSREEAPRRGVGGVLVGADEPRARRDRGGGGGQDVEVEAPRPSHHHGVGRSLGDDARRLVPPAPRARRRRHTPRPSNRARASRRPPGPRSRCPRGRRRSPPPPGGVAARRRWARHCWWRRARRGRPRAGGPRRRPTRDGLGRASQTTPSRSMTHVSLDGSSGPSRDVGCRRPRVVLGHGAPWDSHRCAGPGRQMDHLVQFAHAFPSR